MIEIPILGALASGTGTILEKSVLKNKKIDIKLYQVVSFLAIVVASLPFLYFFWKLDAEAFLWENIAIFAGVIASSILANILIFYAEKSEKLTVIEPAKILEPLFVITLAIVFSFFVEGFYDGGSNVLIPAIIAGLALTFPYIKKDKLKLNKYFVATIFGSLFFALELILTNLILSFYSPLTFYFFRCLFVFAISLIIFRPNFKHLNKKISLMILATGAIWVIYRVALYFGYLNLGVVSTTLIIMLGPVFIYLLSWIFLKEKLNWKNIVSALIIIGCVVWAILI
jgi:drug/metabolite transporter (DMT)-like permease